MSNEWQTVDTAPTDGTPFLAACRELDWVYDSATGEDFKEVETTRLVVVRAQKNRYRNEIRWVIDSYDAMSPDVTHWMLLPEVPK